MGAGHHGFSQDCMTSLEAICETIIPSVELNDADLASAAEDLCDEGEAATEDLKEAIAALYQFSGCDAGLPDKVADTLAEFLRPSDVANIRKLLWLLSTRFGTLLLCGRDALFWDQKSSSSLVSGLLNISRPFTELPRERREKILRSWSLGPSTSASLRLSFIVFKMFILRIFYSRADPKLWKALSYCGPDPRPASLHAQPDSCDRILESRIVDMKQPSPEAAMAKLGLSPTVDETAQLRRIRLSFDAVVVGSGSGGAVAAAQIAKAGYSVAVLEKGDYLPRTQNTLLETESYGLYELGSYLSTQDGSVCLFAGNTVGGGSAINWGASLRTPAHVRREWAEQLGLEKFAEEEYTRALEAVCERMGVQDAEPEPESLANAALRRGCRKLGMHVATVPTNAAPGHFCGWCGMGCRSGQKQSTTRTWLVDAAGAGAVIFSGCEARKVIVSGGWWRRRRANGVVARYGSADGGGEVQLDAKVVVAACGSLWTPVLLRRSGLRNPHIGKNLRVHPVMVTWAHLSKAATSGRKSYEGGIMTAYSTQAANWETSGYGAVLMVPTLHPGALACFLPWRGGRDNKDTMRQMARTVTIVAITRDSEPEAAEVVEDNDGRLVVKYKMSEPDRENCLTAVGNAVRVLAAAGACRVGSSCLDGARLDLSNDGCGGDEERLEAFVTHIQSTAIRDNNTPIGSAHQMGTCRMGVSPAVSAVDPSGRTWEVDGLYVADASVFPTASGVNPMVTIMATAFCTSQSVIEFLRQQPPVPSGVIATASRL